MTHTTSEVLNLAADLIEKRGWASDGSGWNCDLPVDAPLCIEGAIDIAMGGTSAWGGFTSGPNLCPAGQAVRRHLEIANTHYHLYQWNDERHIGGGSVRTQAEVIEVLRATAVIEAARESAAVRESVSA